MRNLVLAISVGLLAPLIFSCGSPSAPVEQTHFTRADSLTDRYLSLYDSIHKIWNVMINDDNQKIEAMQHLLHEVNVSQPDSNLRSLESRINQLMRMRYTQKSMANRDVISEYDIATDAMLDELLSNVQSRREYSYNKTLQKLVNDIHVANERLVDHRFLYDSVVWSYNKFIEANQEFLRKTDETLKLEKKPTFRMASDQ